MANFPMSVVPPGFFSGDMLQVGPGENPCATLPIEEKVH